MSRRCIDFAGMVSKLSGKNSAPAAPFATSGAVSTRGRSGPASPSNQPGAFDGGRTQARTVDPLIKSQLLYQLSYAPIKNIRFGLAERAAGRKRPCNKQGRACPAVRKPIAAREKAPSARQHVLCVICRASASSACSATRYRPARRRPACRDRRPWPSPSCRPRRAAPRLPPARRCPW